jgi:hypothetical protein
MAIGGVNVGQELLNVPMGDMIRSMALAIAQAQWELDKSSMTVTELMSGQRLLRDLDSGKLLDKTGKATGETTEPTIIDSRVYFGYTYVQFDLDSNNKFDGEEPTLEQAAAILAATGKPWNQLKAGDREKLKSGMRTPQKLSMIELGFVPNFYQFVETIIEVKIDIHIHGSTDDSRSNTASSQAQQDTYANSGYWWWYNQGARTTTVSTSQVNASYSSKYSYDVTGSSLLRVRLVPVPPPPVLEARIRDLMEVERAWQLAQLEAKAKPKAK